MADDKKIYMIPDVDIIDSKVDVAGIPYDVFLVALIVCLVLVLTSGSFPLMRILSIPLGVAAAFAYYHFFAKRDKNFYKQITYKLTLKNVRGMPRSTDDYFVE